MPTTTARRATTAVLAAGAALVATVAPAGACGGLVGENGTIQLTKTTTLAAYHDGVERYVTSFEFTGEGASGVRKKPLSSAHVPTSSPPPLRIVMSSASIVVWSST